jgi:hypothetical protein
MTLLAELEINGRKSLADFKALSSDLDGSIRTPQLLR